MASYEESPIHSRLRLTVGIIYVLNLLGLSFIGLIVAYVKRADGWGTMWEGHFTFIIRTFWISALAVAALAIALIAHSGRHDPSGALMLAAVLILFSLWVLVRNIVGLLRTLNDKPTPDPSSLFL